MEHKYGAELSDDALEGVAGGARTIIANTNPMPRPDGRDQDEAECQDPPKPRMLY